MSQVLQQKVTISEISLRALEQASEWKRTAERHYFDWSKVRNTFRSEPKRLEMAVWSGDRLCGLGLGLLANQSLELRFVEGNGAADCPLKGRRLLTVLECAANYTQACGRRQIRLQPINEDLAELYERVYGFVRESQRGQKPFFKKEV